MIFRKAKHSHSTSDLDARDRRRRGDQPEQPAEGPPEGYQSNHQGGHQGQPTDGAAAATRQGPYDGDEVDAEVEHTGRIDLGGLQVRPQQGQELRLQVDEQSENVVAALVVQGESALELRAFAAPRSGSLWDEIRQDITSETSRRGGMVSERRGPYGVELEISVPAQDADGSHGTQSSRIVGIDGPRWFLRATLVGRAAQDPNAAGALLATLADVVVVRGKAPMAPRDMIPMHVPHG